MVLKSVLLLEESTIVTVAVAERVVIVSVPSVMFCQGAVPDAVAHGGGPPPVTQDGIPDPVAHGGRCVPHGGSPEPDGLQPLDHAVGEGCDLLLAVAFQLTEGAMKPELALRVTVEVPVMVWLAACEPLRVIPIVEDEFPETTIVRIDVSELWFCVAVGLISGRDDGNVVELLDIAMVVNDAIEAERFADGELDVTIVLLPDVNDAPVALIAVELMGAVLDELVTVA